MEGCQCREKTLKVRHKERGGFLVHRGKDVHGRGIARARQQEV